jgi:serine beta-lactamase-like protein LACTB, mitochondrial
VRRVRRGDMAKRRTETWLLLGVVGMGMIPVAIVALWGYMSATATPLHPDPTAAPAVTASLPAARWAEAVAEGRQRVRAALTEQNLPGLSVAVGVGGDLVWAEGFGWADLDTQAPVTPETRFRIGTASIPLTSAAAGLLLEEGRLELDREIQAYVPGYPRKDWPVTLQQLMGHVAGVRNDGGDEGPLFSMSCERPVEAVAAFGERPLLFEPGTRFRYSSYGWILVSAALEAAAATPFLALMRERVFEPLGMGDTKADTGTEPMPNRATFYFPRFAAEPRYGLHLMRPIDLSCYAGSSAFLSTPSDLVRFATAIERGTLLRPETVELLRAPLRLASGEEAGYALGWEVETVILAGARTRRVGHGGSTLGGPVASLMTFPEHGIAVAVLSNISYAQTEALGMSLAQVFAVRR